MTDPAAVSAVDVALDQFRGLLADVTPDDLDRPTPCEDWTVADVVNHVVHGLGNFATMVRGDDVDWSAQPALVAADPLPAFDKAAADLRDAWKQPDGDASPDMQCAELAVHTWDLSRGLGRDTRGFDESVAERGLAMIEQGLTDENRGDAFGPPLPAPDGANAYDRIAAFAGREV